jgi:cellulose synthase/poly-beta-1,6-N-acetylglucosamine synthase-like glycosyltransferase
MNPDRNEERESHDAPTVPRHRLWRRRLTRGMGIAFAAAVCCAPDLPLAVSASAALPDHVALAAAVVTDLSPGSGGVAGGTRVRISGNHFADAIRVRFGGVPGSDLVVVSDSAVEVTTPARRSGTVNVQVDTVAGRGEASPDGQFKYLDPPTLSAISPQSGSDTGGTLVAITGSDLSETSAVTFGSEAAHVVAVSSGRVLVASSAHNGEGPVDVRVTTPGGTTGVTPGNQFSYYATPTATSLSPRTGHPRGGMRVTVHGEHLSGVTEVRFGNTPGTGLVVVSDTELRVVAPPVGAPGEMRVQVSGPGGVGTAPLKFSFARSTASSAASGHGFLPLGVIGLLSWGVWFVRRFLSRHRYRPVVNDFSTTTSLVVPVYREDPDVLERCLRTWVREDPTEVILVIDDEDEMMLRRVRQLGLDRVRVLPWHHTGKRGALGAGVRAARGEIVVFADSDTEWRPGLLRALQMPFADRSVGGVGSRQHVYLPGTSIWRRVAYWLLNCRYLDYVPAMSRGGGVGCLSGRTAAYRRQVILPLLPALEHERFLGRECVAGDDGRLTWLVLAAGYRTVHQDTAQVDSMFPDELRAFLKQRIRWSRNSYRCYLTALSQGWLRRQPLVTQITVLQILLTPLSMGAAIWYGGRWIGQGGWSAAVIMLIWAVAGRALRGISHLRERPQDILIAPVVALTVALIALPVKLWAALTMNRQGWLTRNAGERVLGQAEIGVIADAG